MALPRTGRPGSPDYVFVGILVALSIFGLVMLASASSDFAKTRFGDSLFYLKHQIEFGLLVGIGGFLAALFINYRWWEKLAPYIYLFSIGCMLLVFTPLGLSAKGGDRWISIGSASFQPSELLKFGLVLFLAAWVSKNPQRIKDFWKGFVPYFLYTLLAVILILVQPSTSVAAITFVAAFSMYIVAGGRWLHILSGGLIAALIFVGIIATSPYRIERVKTFFNPTADPLGAGYQIDKTRLAIGAGGLTGVGYGQSTTKLKYLPEPIGDSIFAVIGEELGFIGASALLITILLFVLRGLVVAKNSAVKFSQLFVAGFATLVGTQAFMNIAAISGVIPLTGVPLPFVSYGGTSLAVLLTMSGIVVTISRYRKK